MKIKCLLPLFLAATYAALAQSAPQKKPLAQQKQQVATSAQTPQQHQDEGTQIFEQNCSRCHNTPEGFSPRISGTILRHMRVRASLSQHDQHVLLQFLNP